MYEQYTDKQIVEMLKPKLTKILGDGMWDTALEHSESGRNLIELIATIYRSAYIRGQLGRSFIIGEKKAKDPVSDFKVGDKVKFFCLNIDDEEGIHNRRFYPPVNTIGEVVESGSDYCFVQWPKDTTANNGVWACPNRFLEKVTEYWVPATKDNVKVGSKVRMIDEEGHRNKPCFFPKIGTVGTVTKVGLYVPVGIYAPLVQWPKGSTGGTDEWYCDVPRLEVLLCE